MTNTKYIDKTTDVEAIIKKLEKNVKYVTFE